MAKKEKHNNESAAAYHRDRAAENSPNSAYHAQRAAELEGEEKAQLKAKLKAILKALTILSAKYKK